MAIGRGEPGGEASHGEVVSFHARLTAAKAQLESLLETTALENKNKVKALLDRCKRLDNDLKSPDYVAKKKREIGNILAYIEAGIKGVPVTKKTLPEEGSKPKDKEDSEKIHEEELKKLEDRLKISGDELEVVRKMHAKDSPEIIDLDKKAKELLVIALRAKSAFNNKKWLFFNKATKDADGLLTQLQIEAKALKSKKKVPEQKNADRNAKGNERASNEAVETQEYRKKVVEDASSALDILIEVRDEMMSKRARLETDSLIRDVRRCLEDASKTNDLEVYKIKMAAVDKYFNEIKNKLPPEVWQEFVGRDAGDPPSQEFITRDQKRVRLNYRDECRRLQGVLRQKESTSEIESKINALEIKITNARDYDRRADMAAALDEIKKDLGSLNAEIQALPDKGPATPPTEVVTDQQKAKLRHYESQRTLLGEMLDKRSGTDDEMTDLERRLVTVGRDLEEAGKSTDKNTLEGLLQPMQGVLDAIRTDINKLPTEDQKNLLLKYRAEFNDLKRELAKRVSNKNFDDQIERAEEKFQRTEKITEKDKLDKGLASFKEFLSRITAIIENFPLKGADLLPPVGFDTSLLTDVQRDVIDNFIPNEFKSLSARVAADSSLAFLEPNLKSIHDKIEQIKFATSADQLNSLLEDILEDIKYFPLEIELVYQANYFDILKAELSSKISTPAIDKIVAKIKEKIENADKSESYKDLQRLMDEIHALNGQLEKDIRALPERETSAADKITPQQKTRLESCERVLTRISNNFHDRVGAEALKVKYNEIVAKFNAAETLKTSADLEAALLDLEPAVKDLGDNFFELPTLLDQAGERQSTYERTYNLLGDAVASLGGKKLADKLMGRFISVKESLTRSSNLWDDLSVVTSSEVIEAVENSKNKLKDLVEVVKQENKKVYQKFQEELQGLYPTSEFVDASTTTSSEEKSLLARAGGWFRNRFKKKKPAADAGLPDDSTASPAAPRRGVLDKIKGVFSDEEVRKVSKEVAYNTITSILGVKAITDYVRMRVWDTGDLAERKKGVKKSKETTESIFKAYQELLQSSEKLKKGEAGALADEVTLNFKSLVAKVEAADIMPEAKKEILGRLWAVSIKHEKNTEQVKEQRDADVKRLLEGYIHAKVSAAQIAKDRLNTALTLLGGPAFRAVAYAGTAVAERFQKARKEHARLNVGRLKEEKEFGFVAKDVIYLAAKETWRAIRFKGSKEGMSKTGKAIDFAKAVGTVLRGLGIYGALLSSNASPEKQIDAILERVKSGEVLKLWEAPIHNLVQTGEGYARAGRTVWNAPGNIVDKLSGGGAQTSHGTLIKDATDHVVQSHRDTEAALAAAAARHAIPEPGSGGSTPEPALPASGQGSVEAPENHVELSPVQKLAVAHKLDKDSYPHLEKLVTGEKGFPELNNDESLARILAAEKAGTGIHSHHKFIKYEINTMVESGAERKQVIFEEILEKGGPARAAEYLKQLNFSRPQLTYIREWVGRGKSAEINWQAFAEKYKAESNTNHEMVQGLWRSMQGEETQDIMNAGLAGKGIDSHIHGQIYYGGVENGKPIISAVEGHDGYITKDQMKLVPNADKQIIGKAQDVSPDKIAPRITRPVVDVSYYPEDGAQPTDALQPARTRITEMVDTKGRRDVVSTAVRVRTLETFRPSGTLVEVPDSAGKAATAEKIPATDKGQSGEVLANVMKDTLGKAGARAEKFAKGIATDVGSMFESNGSDQITPDNTVTTIDTQLKENLALFNARADQYVNAVQAAYSNMQNGFDYKGSGADLVREQFNNNFRTPMEYILKSQKGVALTSDEKMAVNNFVDTLKRGVNSSEGIKGEELLLARDSGADKLQIVANGSRAFRIKKPDGSGEILFGSDEFKFKTTPTGKLLKIGAQGVPVGKPMSYDEALALADPEHYPLLATK